MKMILTTILFASSMAVAQTVVMTGNIHCEKQVAPYLQKIEEDLIAGDKSVVAYKNGKFVVDTKAPGYESFATKGPVTTIRVKTGEPSIEWAELIVTANASDVSVTFQTKSKSSAKINKFEKIAFSKLDASCKQIEGSSDIAVKEGGKKSKEPVEHILNTPGKIKATQGIN